jgi:hypothetical protein
MKEINVTLTNKQIASLTPTTEIVPTPGEGFQLCVLIIDNKLCVATVPIN